MANYKHAAVQLPTIFDAKPYFDFAYKKRTSELADRTYEVGYAELKTLYPSYNFDWQINKYTKICCKVDTQLNSHIIGFQTYYRPRFKVASFRTIHHLVCTDMTLQLQVYFSYAQYRARQITAIRYRFAQLCNTTYDGVSGAQFFESAITTDNNPIYLTLKGQYPLLRMYLITKCKIV